MNQPMYDPAFYRRIEDRTGPISSIFPEVYPSEKKEMQPITFNGTMVRAIEDDIISTVRRLLPSPNHKNRWIPKHGEDRVEDIWMEDGELTYPYYGESYHVGDILYVREAVAIHHDRFRSYETYHYTYAADTPDVDIRWMPAITMPREAARTFLRVTNVRRERLQDMSLAEYLKDDTYLQWERDLIGENNSIIVGWARTEMAWNSLIDIPLISTYGWEANPYMQVIEFEKTDANTALVTV